MQPSPSGLISSTRGTPDNWARRVSDDISRRETRKGGWSKEILSPDEVRERLDPYRMYFTGYDFYALVLHSELSEKDIESHKFFMEAAVSSHHAGLVLMPETIRGTSLIDIIDPFPAIRTLAEHPIARPCVVFWTELQSACVLPLKEAQSFYRRDILPALDQGSLAVHKAIQNATRSVRTKRILHLSDLHFGTREAAKRRSWLKEQLAKELPSIDRVVVTGDLFDNPTEPLRETFDEFRLDIESMTHKDVLVIPGNHDVRRKGNALAIFGRKPEYITDLRWAPVVTDEELQTIFFSFNSSETGNLATGAVSERQRLDRSVLVDREIRRNPRLGEFLKVALVHHHPIAYESKPTSAYEHLMAKFGGEERFIAFTNADEFLEWCAARGISLVLHGHKHIPHWATRKVAVQNDYKRVTIVGCGSTTGVEGKPMCYDIVTLDPETKQWNVLFYHDEKGDGSGFGIQNVALNFFQ